MSNIYIKSDLMKAELLESEQYLNNDDLESKEHQQGWNDCLKYIKRKFTVEAVAQDDIITY